MNYFPHYYCPLFFSFAAINEVNKVNYSDFNNLSYLYLPSPYKLLQKILLIIH